MQLLYSLTPKGFLRRKSCFFLTETFESGTY
jgi:hypothetical protein